MSEANSLQSSGVPRQRRRQSTSEGAAARAAKMTELIDETTRSDGHASLLCGELSKAEHEVSWLAAALQTAKDAVAHAERTTEQHQQHYEIEFEASKRLRALEAQLVRASFRSSQTDVSHGNRESH